MAEQRKIPLFPLSTVLYPGGPLPLRLFEARYIDMVSQCMRDELPFGVVGISEGREVGPSKIYSMGTEARITDFYQGSDGLLGVTAIGENRFRLIAEQTAADGLRWGEVEAVAAEATVALPTRFSALAEMLDSILDDLGKLYEDHDRLLDDATWIGYRFSEILPLTIAQKQHCLEIEDATERLEIIAAVLSRVPNKTEQ